MPRKLDESIQYLLKKNPQCINVLDEQVDIDVQVNYFKRAGKLHKQVYEFKDVMTQVPLLYDSEIRIEEKRDILVKLARFDTIEIYHLLQNYSQEAEGELKFWALMAFQECKMNIKTSLLGERQIFISSGLGGHGTSLRYFIAMAHKDKKDFLEYQKELMRTELQKSCEQNLAKIESLQFQNFILKIVMLIPLQVDDRDIFQPIRDVCQEYGDFLADNFFMTNVGIPSDELVEEFLKKNKKLRKLSDFELSEYDSSEYDEEDDDNDDIDDDDDDGIPPPPF